MICSNIFRDCHSTNATKLQGSIVLYIINLSFRVFSVLRSLLAGPATLIRHSKCDADVGYSLPWRNVLSLNKSISVGVDLLLPAEYVACVRDIELKTHQI